MKKSIAPRLVTLFLSFVFALSLHVGFSNFLTGNKVDTSDKISASANIGSKSQVTVTIKYDVVNNIVKPDYAYSSTDDKLSPVVGKEKSTTNSDNYNAILSFLRDYTDFGYKTTIDKKEYYPNGKLKRSMVKDKELDKKVEEAFHDNGKPQSKKIVEWKENANLIKDSKGNYHYESGFVETTNIQYDRNGNVIKKANIQK